MHIKNDCNFSVWTILASKSLTMYHNLIFQRRRSTTTCRVRADLLSLFRGAAVETTAAALTSLGDATRRDAARTLCRLIYKHCQLGKCYTDNFKHIQRTVKCCKWDGLWSAVVTFLSFSLCFRFPHTFSAAFSHIYFILLVFTRRDIKVMRLALGESIILWFNS